MWPDVLPGCDGIVTGSLAGMLRVHRAQPDVAEADALLAETQLPWPILDVLVGPILPGSHSSSMDLGIAVLGAQAVALLSLAAPAGGADAPAGGTSTRAPAGDGSPELQVRQTFDLPKLAGGSFSAAKLLREHSTLGRHVQVRSPARLGVVATDGRLMLLESQASAAVVRFRHTVLPPAVVAVAPRVADAASHAKASGWLLLAGDDTGAVSAYQYPALVKAASTGEAPRPLWRIVLGEVPRALLVGRYARGLAPAQCDIVVVGNRSIFMLAEHGGLPALGNGMPATADSSQPSAGQAGPADAPMTEKPVLGILQPTGGGAQALRWTRRLGWTPALCSLVARPSATVPDTINHNLLVTRRDPPLLQVWRETRLIWAASLPWAPVALQPVTAGGVRGFLAALSKHGRLSLLHLGTAPHTDAAPAPQDTRDLDYAAMDAEYRKLMAGLRAAAAGVDSAANSSTLIARVHSVRAVSCAPDGSRQCALQLALTYTGETRLAGARLALKCPPGVTLCSVNGTPCDSAEASLPSIPGSGDGGRITPLNVQLVLASVPRGMPHTGVVELCVTYSTLSGSPRVCVTPFTVPLALWLQPVPPAPAGDHKLTLEGVQAPAPHELFASELFAAGSCDPGVAAAAAAAGPGILSLAYANGAVVTIAQGKSGTRWRLQAEYPEALALAARVLLRKVRASSPSLSLAGPVPLGSVVDAGTQHLRARHALQQAATSLNSAAMTLRQVQKRVLSRARERAPADPAALGKLLEYCISACEQEARAYESSAHAVIRSANVLACALQLFVLLAQVRYSLAEASAMALRNALQTDIAAEAGLIDPSLPMRVESGWHEHAEVGLVGLLRSISTRSDKESESSALVSAALRSSSGPAGNAAPDSMEKLQRLLARLVEKLEAGHASFE